MFTNMNKGEDLSESSVSGFETAKEIMDNSFRIYEKIEEAKRMFLEAVCDENVAKSGKNNFQNFKYFELGDIVPTALGIFDELHLATKYTLTSVEASMIVFDLDNKTKTRYTCPVELYDQNQTSQNINQKTQTIGSIQTYTRRYLYMQILDIVDPDTIDSKNNKLSKKISKSSRKTGNDIHNTTHKAYDKIQFANSNKTDHKLIKLSREVAENMTGKGIILNQENLKNFILDLFQKKKLTLDEYNGLLGLSEQMR